MIFGNYATGFNEKHSDDYLPETVIMADIMDYPNIFSDLETIVRIDEKLICFQAPQTT